MKGTSFRSINPIKSQEVSALGENTLSPCRNAERVTHPLISSHQTITHHLHSHTLQPCTCLNSQLLHKHVDDFFNILSSGFFHNHTDMLFFLSWKNKNKKPASYIPMLFLPLKRNFSKELSVLTVSNTSSHFFLKTAPVRFSPPSFYWKWSCYITDDFHITRSNSQFWAFT